MILEEIFKYKDEVNDGTVTFGKRYADRRDYANRSLLAGEPALQTGPGHLRGNRFGSRESERREAALLEYCDSSEGVKIRPRKRGPIISRRNAVCQFK